MENIKCVTCGSETKAARTADSDITDSCKVFIDNIPCHKCVKCDEIMYSGKVVENIEMLVSTVENDLGAVIYLDYEKCLRSKTIKVA